MNGSLQRQISKIFETIYCTKLTPFLESNDLLENFQYVFRKSRTTKSAINKLNAFVYKAQNKAQLQLK